MKLRWLLLVAPLALACADKDKDTAEVVYPDDDGDGYTSDVDCRDDDPAINPGADEYCDGVDHNCDTLAQFNAVDGYTVYLDGDLDGFGDAETTKSTCAAVQGYVDNSDDCDDRNPNIYPGALEICDDDDDDEDCSGAADDDDETVDVSTYSVFYEDVDGDGYGVAESTVERCDAGEGYAPLVGDCDDDEANANPGLTEVCGDLIDNDCDGSSNTCGPNGELDLGDYTSAAGDTQSGLGSSVAPFDSDGFLVGAPATIAGTKGSAMVLDSSLSGITLSGSKNGEQAGSAVSGGDVDNDGAADALVGAPGYDVSQQSSNQGRVYLVLNPTSSGALDSGEIYTGDSSDNAGSMVALLDWDGSGGDEIFASDRTSVMVLSSSMAVEQSSSGDYVTVLAGGDLDGDGAEELLIGVSGSSELHVLADGELGGDYDDGTATLTGLGGEGVGSAVAARCDVDGDGQDDMAVGASNASGSKGRAYLITDLSGGLAGAAATVEGTAQYKLGTAVALLDIDADGHCDVVVGGPGAGTNTSGVSWLYYGPVSGTLHPVDADASFAGEGDFAAAGTTLSNAGDLDGDGYDDLAVGAPGDSSLAGAVYLVNGGGI